MRGPGQAALRIPAELASHRGDPAGLEWIASLPATVAMLARTWTLTIGPPFEPGGQTAWVAPAFHPRHGVCVLKVGFWHDEATHEPDALRLWDGHGAVRLHDALRDRATSALLLERCHLGTSLGDRPVVEQDAVLATLLPRLWVDPPTGHPFRPLAQMCGWWADEAAVHHAALPAQILPASVLEHGLGLFRSLPYDADRHTVVATDLHAANVLAAEREPWLAIDPKPYVGDPTYDAGQHLLNTEARLVEDPVAAVTTVATALALDPSRAIAWLFARTVVESWHTPPLATVATTLARHLSPRWS